MTNLDKAIRNHKNAKEFWAIECIRRDGRKCGYCNLDEFSAYLLVHHLDESRKNRGRMYMNNNLNNLITLCKKCHAKIHKQNKNRIDILEKRALARLNT